ncbi:2,3-bisphosphoglycerate-independent phosphoglycerate mutase [Candidatus Parcubacteria bacterium]|nr:MAG: 2,3-bisphosphoglycerate-independent phosphoglycerate mutase [Candidatus Parcubacteria bacterium]
MAKSISKSKSKKTVGNKKPTVLLILDGWGLAKPNKGNAITLSKTPVMDKLQKKFPHTELQASGKYAGLPPFQPGNSEAGHMNLGAGRIADQDAIFISKEINTGRFFKNPAFMEAYQHIVRNNSKLHIMGMLSNGLSAHSDPDHLLALLSWARQKKIKNTYLHLFTDGRDSPQRSGLKLIEALMRGLKNSESGAKRTGEWIATISGRFYAMDRKKNWENTEKAYNSMVLGQGKEAVSPQAAITQSYNRGETDEYILPYVIKRSGKPISVIDDGDAVIFFNLRSDRARQLAKPFVQKEFNKQNPGSFKRQKILKNIVFVAMTDFGPDLDHIITAYPSPDLAGTIPMALKNKKQLYIAESEKFAHVTYFFNGGFADPVAGEDRIKIDSPDVASYDKRPEMSAVKITGRVIKLLKEYDFICVNFANPDMVGHTGNINAAVMAVEAVDKCVGKIYNAVAALGGFLIITADHGNIEKMINLKTGEVFTEHTANPVPFILAGNLKSKKIKAGKLGDVAPTILKIMGIAKPKEMTGSALF